MHRKENKMQQSNVNHQCGGICHWRMAAIVAFLFPAVALLPQPALAQVPNSLLPHNLSPWGMFLNADIVVKAVMVGLAFASLVTWTVWLAKTIELQRERCARGGGCARSNLAAALRDAVRACGGDTDAVAQLILSTARESELSGGSSTTISRNASRCDWSGSRRRCAADVARHRRAGDHRRDRAVRRPVRHGVGHHELVHRHREFAHHQPRGGGAWHRRSAARHRNRASSPQSPRS